MQRSGRACMLLAAILLCLGPALAKEVAEAQDERVTKLLARRSAVPDRIIALTSEEWEEFAFTPERPYSLVVFCAAKSLMNSPKTQLGKLRAEFVLAAQAYARAPDADYGTLFFVDLWYDRSGPLFKRMGIATVPFSFVWTPSQSTGKEGAAVRLREENRLHQGFTKYPWPAEEVVDKVRAISGVAAAEVDRPSTLKSPLFPFLALGVLMVLGMVAWALYNSPLVHNKLVWAAGSLVVYWFSVSGGMYNIIRGMPLFMQGQNGKVVWWMDGRQGQLGAEGFFMGSLYMAFAMSLCVLMYGAPRVSDDKARSVLSLAALGVAAVTLYQSLTLWQFKTGFSTRNFFF